MNDEKRKNEHIDLTSSSQTNINSQDIRFNYEPLLSAHPTIASISPTPFLGKILKAPIWISSMTGGANNALVINKNLAKVAGEFGLGMGLGSCRALLESEQYLEDFFVRDLVGDSLLFANLGISQLEKLYIKQNFNKAIEIVSKLQADGMIIHINPLQEWFQDEGDRLKYPAIHTLKAFISECNFPVIVKEVGQGIGPKSLEALIEVGVSAIEFAAYGGTNFSTLEAMRSHSMKSKLDHLSLVGHPPDEMLRVLNRILLDRENNDCHIIISGGLKSSIDGYFYIQNSRNPAAFAMASGFLKYAQGEYEKLREYTSLLIEEYAMAEAFLELKYNDQEI